MINASTPTLTQFDPNHIPFQMKVIRDVRRGFDYSDGKKHELLLSGSVGSSKSLLMAHLGITHCLMYSGARFGWFRRRMPDLRATIVQKCLEHIGDDLRPRIDFEYNRTTSRISFSNGSEMIARSWNDKQFFRLRSLELSAAGIEELTENDDDYAPAYDELYARIGRLPHVPESFLVSATNPDAPSHWAYRRFMLDQKPTRHVYYSITTDNPFLPKEYVKQLLENMDPKLARRMVYGEWIELTKDVIYYQYQRERNYKDQEYTIDAKHPIHVCWDFNIGEGKPLSACFFQHINGVFHVFDEVIVEGMRTLDSCEEMDARGLLSHRTIYHLHGDATGKARSTKALHSDWETIEKYFANRKGMRFQLRVPVSNPPVRKRHNIVNAQCLNAAGQVRLFVYRNAKTVDEGLRLTALKKGGQYIEDDSKQFQHVTTALGYGIVEVMRGIEASQTMQTFNRWSW